MEKKTCRKGILEHLDTTLILFELVLSVIFILIGHFAICSHPCGNVNICAKLGAVYNCPDNAITVPPTIGNTYFGGVGVGLLIAWVTSAIAYLYKKKTLKP